MTDFSLAGFLLSLAAAAALLIWSVRLVRTGVERGFGRPLRGWIAKSGQSRLMAVVSGLAAALILQSATAVLALVAGFSGAGAFTVAAGTAVLLGADLGSALVVRLMSLHVSQAMPVFLLGGVLLFLKGPTGEIRQGGRILIGLALIFVSLDMIRNAAEPIVGHAGVGSALHYLGNDPVSAFVIGAVLAWLVHSSVATILLVVTLTGHGILGLEAAAAIVLGANLGSCLIAVGLTLGANAHARSIVYANLIARGGGAVCALGLLGSGVVLPSQFGADPALAAINLHIAFNAAIIVTVLPWVGHLARLAHRVAAVFESPDHSILDRLPDAAQFAAAPQRALPRIRREVLRMGQMVDALQRETLPLLFDWNSTRATEITETAGQLRARHIELKLLVATLHDSGAKLSPHTQDAISDLMRVGAAIEDAACVLSGDLILIARDMARRGVLFSIRGQTEIRQFADEVAANIELALSVLERDDSGAAAELIERKASLRDLEQELRTAHMSRLAQRNPESIASSSQHQDVLRSLKQVNSSMAQIANVLLERRGELSETRLLRV